MPACLRKAMVATATRIVLCALLVIAAAPATRAAGSSGRFVDWHGPVIRAAQVHIVYWGTAWADILRPAAEQVTASVRAMMTSDFMTGLHQYRGIGRGTVRAATTVSDADAPMRFDDADVRNLLEAQFSAGTIARPDADNQALYLVMARFGAQSRAHGYPAEHSYYQGSGHRVHFAWVTPQDVLALTTALISHEIVEAATDPEGSAVLGEEGTCDRPGWCEISDVCSRAGEIDGVVVGSYWSNADRACVISGDPPAAPRRQKPHQGRGEVHLVTEDPPIRTTRRREH